MAYNASNTYATVAQCQERTGPAGWIAVSDLDYDDTVDSDELGNAEESVNAANNIVDEALVNYFENLDVARQAGNEWLKDRCIDIALFRLSTMGGREAPQSISAAYDDAIVALGNVGRGDSKVPRLDYPTPSNYNGSSRRVPRVINPAMPRRRRRWR